MNPLRDRHRRAWGRRHLGVLLCLGLASGGSHATGTDWQSGAHTVRELMRTETQVAEPVAAVTAPPVRVSSAPRLTALYGTAGHFTVVLDVDGVRKEYRPGASLPYGGTGAGSEYRLVRIVDACVVLRRGSHGRLRTACFVPQTVAAPAPDHGIATLPSGAGLSSPLPLSGGMP